MPVTLSYKEGFLQVKSTVVKVVTSNSLMKNMKGNGLISDYEDIVRVPMHKFYMEFDPKLIIKSKSGFKTTNAHLAPIL